MRLYNEDKFRFDWIRNFRYNCEQGNYNDAMFYLDLFLYDPNFKNVYYYVYYLKSLISNDLRQKILNIDKSLELKSDFAIGLIERAFLSSNLREAKKYINSALKIKPKDLSILVDLGSLYGLHKKSKMAIRIYKQVLEADSDNARVHALLGFEYLVQNNIRESESNIQRSLELNPTLFNGHLFKGILNIHKHNYKEAILNLTRAKKFNEFIFKDNCDKLTQKIIIRARNAYKLVQILEPIDKDFNSILTNSRELVELKNSLETINTKLNLILLKVGDLSLPAQITELLLTKEDFILCFINILEFREVDFKRLHDKTKIFLEWNHISYIDLFLSLERFYHYFRENNYSSLNQFSDLEQANVLMKIKPLSVFDGELTSAVLNSLNTQMLLEIRKDAHQTKVKVDLITKKIIQPDEDLLAILNILNLPLAEKDQTRIFISLDHDTLCERFEKFLRKRFKNRDIIAEIDITHNMRDEGVDILLNFALSGIKVGFQIKDYKEINNKDFSGKLDEQITRSRRLCDYYFIAFGGDMRNKRHFIKINGKILRIRIGRDKYTHTISPQQLYSIINTN